MAVNAYKAGIYGDNPTGLRTTIGWTSENWRRSDHAKSRTDNELRNHCAPAPKA